MSGDALIYYRDLSLIKYIIEYIEKRVQVLSSKYCITKDIAYFRGDRILGKNIIGIP